MYFIVLGTTCYTQAKEMNHLKKASVTIFRVEVQTTCLLQIWSWQRLITAPINYIKVYLFNLPCSYLEVY